MSSKTPHPEEVVIADEIVAAAEQRLPARMKGKTEARRDIGEFGNWIKVGVFDIVAPRTGRGLDQELAHTGELNPADASRYVDGMADYLVARASETWVERYGGGRPSWIEATGASTCFLACDR